MTPQTPRPPAAGPGVVISQEARETQSLNILM
ncbi:hypothetical protein JS278_02303 [Acidipropionibacterium virtanenii]|uniref:Uncharacterized protein n=1 Tax=Acidipropionibacterium virtanenii TaxID=2057246 RepID=A0A344UW01_9ACTN|nr:hypothetical protein JS278_02303 [Acidipropionibacterium virtanenii]